MALKFEVDDSVRVIGGYLGKRGLIGKVVSTSGGSMFPYDVVLPGYADVWIFQEDELEGA
jgi:hypothetical protein